MRVAFDSKTERFLPYRGIPWKASRLQARNFSTLLRAEWRTAGLTRRAILLAIGSFKKEAFNDQDRGAFLDRTAKLYETDPDAGMHSASEWVLRSWGSPPPAAERPRADSSPKPSQWLTGPEGHTLAVVDGHVRAAMGSPSTEERRSMAEVTHQVVIGRKFALGTKEVTVEQFRRFSQATGLKMPPFTPQAQPRRQWPDDYGDMVSGGSILPLAERAGWIT